MVVLRVLVPEVGATGVVVAVSVEPPPPPPQAVSTAAVAIARRESLNVDFMVVPFKEVGDSLLACLM